MREAICYKAIVPFSLPVIWLQLTEWRMAVARTSSSRHWVCLILLARRLHAALVSTMRAWKIVIYCRLRKRKLLRDSPANLYVCRSSVSSGLANMLMLGSSTGRESIIAGLQPVFTWKEGSGLWQGSGKDTCEGAKPQQRTINTYIKSVKIP